jgi:hypothetical protein
MERNEILEQNKSPKVAQDLHNETPNSNSSKDLELSLKQILVQITLEGINNEKKKHIEFFNKSVLPLIVQCAKNGKWVAILRNHMLNLDYLLVNYTFFEEICSSNGLTLSQNKDRGEIFLRIDWSSYK